MDKSPEATWRYNKELIQELEPISDISTEALDSINGYPGSHPESACSLSESQIFSKKENQIQASSNESTAIRDDYKPVRPLIRKSKANPHFPKQFYVPSGQSETCWKLETVQLKFSTKFKSSIHQLSKYGKLKPKLKSEIGQEWEIVEEYKHLINNFPEDCAIILKCDTRYAGQRNEAARQNQLLWESFLKCLFGENPASSDKDIERLIGIFTGACCKQRTYGQDFTIGPNTIWCNEPKYISQGLKQKNYLANYIGKVVKKLFWSKQS